MRIALVVHKLPPFSVGGTEIYTHNLGRALSETHDVAVFYREDSGDQGLREGGRRDDGYQRWRAGPALGAEPRGVIGAFFDTFLNPGVERSFAEFLDSFQPDLVHFQHLMLLSFRLMAQARRRGIPRILTLHDYWFICANSQLVWPDGRICTGKALGLNCARCASARIERSWMRIARPAIALLFQARDALVSRAALQADRLIAPSRFLIERYIQAGFPPERFVFLENGLDVGRVRRSSRRESSARDPRLRVTYLGSLAWQKGVDVLVKAFRALPPDRAVLRVFGNPDVFPDYAADLRVQANPENTSFEGSVPNDQVGAVLAETDLLAVPSVWFENSPVVIQEARAAGVPVMASAHGALEEKVRDGVDGILVPPGDVGAWHEALCDLMRDPHRVAAMAAESPEPMTVREHVAILETIYRAVLASDG